MARIVVAGAGAIGASVAYHLALRGAPDVVLADRGEVGSGSTGKAMGGVRQQFSTEPEVRLARDSIRFFEELGPSFFHQVGYLFLATTRPGLAELEERMALQRSLGVPVERAALPAGVRGDDVLGAVACWRDGVADPPAVTRELVRRARERETAIATPPCAGRLSFGRRDTASRYPRSGPEATRTCCSLCTPGAATTRSGALPRAIRSGGCSSR